MDREHLILELKTIRQNGTEICEEILRMTGELKKLEEEKLQQDRRIQLNFSAKHHFSHTLNQFHQASG